MSLPALSSAILNLQVASKALTSWLPHSVAILDLVLFFKQVNLIPASGPSCLLVSFLSLEFYLLVSFVSLISLSILSECLLCLPDRFPPAHYSLKLKVLVTILIFPLISLPPLPIRIVVL